MQPTITVSVVSHRHGALLPGLMDDLAACGVALEILITANVPEDPAFAASAKDVRILTNAAPMGFGANHNAAFRASRGDFFCVLNPDMRVPPDVFPALLERLNDASIGAIAPRITDPAGQTEDAARRFPTPWSILHKALGLERAEALPARGMAYPDWIGGMFMLIPRAAFARAGGFDESYYLYYEDVDLCARLRRLGYRIACCTDVAAVHDARRASHRNVRHLRWHLSSMARFFWRRASGRL